MRTGERKGEDKTKTMEKIKNLILDFGGILVDLDKQAAIEAFRQIGAPEVGGLIDECQQMGILRDFETGMTSIEEFCQEVRRVAQHCHASDEEIVKAWEKMLVSVPQTRLEILCQLKKDYRLFVLSNTNAVHWRQAKEYLFQYKDMNVDDFFEGIFLSFEMKKSKPSPDIFSEALCVAGLNPEETIFVDDSLANCKGAEAVGIRTIHAATLEKALERITLD